MRTVDLKGLEGIKRKVVHGLWFRSVNSAMQGLLMVDAVSTAADNGAINIWVDDEGIYRAERMAWMTTRSRIESKFKSDIKKWLKVELPLIY